MPNPQSGAYRTNAYQFLPRWSAPILLAVALAAAVMPGTNARAEDSILTWIVKSISAPEDGEYIRASTMQVPQIGDALATGTRISTTGGQSMVLVNGRDLVAIDPNTTVTIGDNDSTTARGNVDLVTGTIHVEVGKRAPGQTFSVGAPYLVATVKGTKFDVTTSNEESTVSVTEGLVAVSAVTTGQSVDVPKGSTATVSRRSLGAPALAPTTIPAGGSYIDPDQNVESASVNPGSTDSSSSGDSGSGGSSPSGSGSGGSASAGASSGNGSSPGSGSGSDIGGAVGGAVSGASGAVGGAVSGATGAVGGAVSGATGAVGGAIGGAVGGAVSGVGGAVGGAVSGVGGAVGGAVGGLGGALGGALGGLGGDR